MSRSHRFKAYELVAIRTKPTLLLNQTYICGENCGLGGGNRAGNITYRSLDGVDADVRSWCL